MYCYEGIDRVLKCERGGQRGMIDRVYLVDVVLWTNERDPAVNIFAGSSDLRAAATCPKSMFVCLRIAIAALNGNDQYGEEEFPRWKLLPCC